MDNQKEQQVKDYIQEKEKTEWNSKLVETVSDLAWLERETKEWFFSWWLKNDKNLLTYAQLHDKKDFLNAWEDIQFKLLELKLSITCPYFADFKDFLDELKLWPDTSTFEPAQTNPKKKSPKPKKESPKSKKESIETWKSKFRGKDIKDIKSEPFEKTYNSRGKTITRCSKTARANWKKFWIILPSWDAYDAWKNPWKDALQTIPANKKNKRPQKSREWINFTTFTWIKEWNYADIYTDSKSNYWHRAAAFKDDNGKRYVLDPYTRVNWKLDNTPKELDDYLKWKKIVKAHIYNSTWYKEKA